MELIGKQSKLRVLSYALTPPALVRVAGSDVALNAAFALAWLGFPREDYAELGFAVRRVPTEAAPAADPLGSHYLTPHFRWEVSGFWPTVLDEITLGGRIPLDLRLQGILRILRLDALAARNPGTLSGGETAKLILACHLAHRPRRIVLDRVLGELDAVTRAAVMAHLRDWTPEAIVFVMDDTVTQGFDATVETDGDVAVWEQGSGRTVAAIENDSIPGGLALHLCGQPGPEPATILRLVRFAAVRAEQAVSAPVDCVASSGDLVLLRGPNGCGKTSLLEALAGLLESQGTLEVEQGGVGLDPARAFALSPQDPLADITELTLADELALACGAEAVPGIVEDLEIPAAWVKARLHADVSLQKLASVVAATVRGRPVCLLDEPTIYLARPMCAIAERAIQRYLGAGGIVLCSTHDADFVDALNRR